MGEYAVHRRVTSQLVDKPQICIVMDHPSDDEVRLNKILAGDFIINRICTQVGIDINKCMLTHALQLKPAQNNLQNFFNKRSEYKALCKDSEWRTPYPITTYGYLKQEMGQDLERLYNEINEAQPNVIIAMGSISLWALTGFDKIGVYRGAVIESNADSLNRNYKIIPSYSPSAVFKNYGFRYHLYSDYKKAKRESRTKQINYEERELWIEPNIEDLYTFETKHIKDLGDTKPLSFDIETAGGQITCIGFAPSLNHAIVVPFTYNYWAEPDRKKAWAWVKRLLEDETIVKVAQNQTYDVSWLKYMQDIEVRGTIHDTMHAQHSLQPELEKGLGFLGSTYTNEGAWKTLAKFSDSTKADE